MNSKANRYGGTALKHLQHKMCYFPQASRHQNIFRAHVFWRPLAPPPKTGLAELWSSLIFDLPYVSSILISQLKYVCTNHSDFARQSMWPFYAFAVVVTVIISSFFKAYYLVDVFQYRTWVSFIISLQNGDKKNADKNSPLATISHTLRISPVHPTQTNLDKRGHGIVQCRNH